MLGRLQEVGNEGPALRTCAFHTTLATPGCRSVVDSHPLRAKLASMRSIPAALVLFAGLALAPPAAADFQEGFTAFRQSDYATALSELLPAAEHGDAGAAILVGVLYANGYGLAAPDWAEAGRWLEAGAAGGPTPVQVIEGAFMGMSRKADQEFAPAYAYFAAQADAGDPAAQFLLAWMTTHGLGADSDPAAGLALLQQAARAGHGEAQFQLAGMLLEGSGVDQDEAAGAIWFGRAAESGHAASQAELAILYASGRGVPQDLALAAEWATQAAKQENAEGQFFLGGLYRDGLGVPRDDVKAFSWTVLAANQNMGAAQLRLASLYLEGVGTPPDVHEAYFWWVLGTLAAFGEYSPLVESLREALTPLLTDLQRAELEHQAIHWLGAFEGALEEAHEH